MKIFLATFTLFLSISYAKNVETLENQVSFLISDLSKVKNVLSASKCVGAARPIKYNEIGKINIVSNMDASEILRKLDYNYMAYMGFYRTGKKSMNGFTVLNYKSAKIHNGYYTMSVKDTSEGALICSVLYKK